MNINIGTFHEFRNIHDAVMSNYTNNENVLHISTRRIFVSIFVAYCISAMFPWAFLHFRTAAFLRSRINCGETEKWRELLHISRQSAPGNYYPATCGFGGVSASWIEMKCARIPGRAECLCRLIEINASGVIRWRATTRTISCDSKSQSN